MICLPHPKMSEHPAYTRLQALLSTIVKSIARNTTNPGIEHFPNEAIFILSVDPRDQGRIVGKKGCTIWAIQSIMWFAGMAQLGWSYKVKLLDPEAPIKGHARPFRFDPKWDRTKIQGLAAAIVETCLPKHAEYRFEETDETSALIRLNIQKYLKPALSDPSFEEAFESVMRAAGMSNGATIKTESLFL